MDIKKEIVNINVHNIFPNAYQPRKFFNEEALEELSQSIQSYGIIQPITVRKIGDKFELVAGERRWRAARMANLESVPCNIIEITDTQSAEIALLENLQREDLNFIEEAEAYYNLINEHNFTQDELAKRMGKKQSTIANKMRLLKLSSKVRLICLENSLTERHARALLKLPDEEIMREVLDKVIKSDLNVKKTEKLIADILEDLKQPKGSEDKKQTVKGIMGMRIYLNTIKQAYEAITNTGLEAKYKEVDKGDHIEVVVKIPKK